MLIEIEEVGGFQSAIRHMRNPTKSHERSDSRFSGDDFRIGPVDARLARSLILKGDDHGKFTRGIMAWMSIKAPRYIWQELDTYTVGSASMSSESTIYTLKRDGAAPSNFEIETPKEIVEFYSSFYEENKDNRRALKQALPESWVQKRGKVFSYQSLRRMYFARKNHPMPEWKVMCDAIEKLPYAKELILCEMAPKEAVKHYGNMLAKYAKSNSLGENWINNVAGYAADKCREK